MWNKKKQKEQRDARMDVDHPQATVPYEQLDKGHKVGCPAKIIAKEAYVFTSIKVNILYTMFPPVDPSNKLLTLSTGTTSIIYTALLAQRLPWKIRLLIVKQH